MTELVDRGVLHPTTARDFPGPHRRGHVRTRDRLPPPSDRCFRGREPPRVLRADHRDRVGQVDGLHRADRRPGAPRRVRQRVRAIVVYPMNALANSQRNELEKFLGKDHPKVTFDRYTGQESHSEREVILQSPPDILLTNYVMLELMLTRPRERSALITSAANLSFLVLDELHTYRGRQGADVAMLIRRLRGAVERRRCSASAPAPHLPVRAPKPNSVNRSPSWPPGSSALTSRRTTSSARRCAGPPAAKSARPHWHPASPPPCGWRSGRSPGPAEAHRRDCRPRRCGRG